MPLLANRRLSLPVPANSSATPSSGRRWRSSASDGAGYHVLNQTPLDLGAFPSAANASNAPRQDARSYAIAMRQPDRPRTVLENDTNVITREQPGNRMSGGIPGR